MLVALRYEKNGLLKKLLVLFKYKYAEDLAPVLAQFLKNLLDEDFLLVPVPLDKRKLKQRGFNQSKLLAQELGPVTDCLKRKVHLKRQAGLTRKDRLNNLDGIFSLKAGFDLKGKKLILIDDVATTGTTLNECSKVLKEAGVEFICALVLARGR